MLPKLWCLANISISSKNSVNFGYVLVECPSSLLELSMVWWHYVVNHIQYNSTSYRLVLNATGMVIDHENKADIKQLCGSCHCLSKQISSVGLNCFSFLKIISLIRSIQHHSIFNIPKYKYSIPIYKYSIPRYSIHVQMEIQI